MAEIVPAILTEDFYELKEKVRSISGLTSYVQIDVVDGVFGERKTWPYGDEEYFGTLVNGEEEFPEFEKINIEVDLMLKDPHQMAEDWVAIGASRIIIHIGSDNSLDAVKNLYSKYALPDNIIHTEIVLAVPYDADVSLIKEYKDYIFGIQVMGIHPIGLQGTAFDRKAIETIKAFKAEYKDLSISIDGGVKRDMIEELKQAGADRIVMGSGIFGNDNPRKTLKEIIDSV